MSSSLLGECKGRNLRFSVPPCFFHLKEGVETPGRQGNTSSGVGTSGLPVRFGCPGEVVLITLKRSPNKRI